MATETAVEKMIREANERKSAAAAADAEKKADATATVDPKVAESKARQEAEEAAADLAARQQAANELLQNAALRGGVPGVTANAGNSPIPVTPASTVRTDVIPITSVDTSLADGAGIEAPWRTFQHLYANANTIMPNGKKLIFGGQNGHIGTYSTNKQDQILHLAELANTPGSMITEVRRDSEGRYIVVTDAILQAETLAALSDSRTNTAHQQNPNVAMAMNNLGRAIAQDS